MLDDVMLPIALSTILVVYVSIFNTFIILVVGVSGIVLIHSSLLEGLVTKEHTPYAISDVPLD